MQRSISREDYLDTDPYGDKEAERQERRDELEYRDDLALEDEKIYGKNFEKLPDFEPKKKG